jgi:hypothetical protein
MFVAKASSTTKLQTPAATAAGDSLYLFAVQLGCHLLRDEPRESYGNEITRTGERNSRRNQHQRTHGVSLCSNLSGDKFFFFLSRHLMPKAPLPCIVKYS